MQRRIEVYINEQQCDYFSEERLPLSIRKQADKFLDLVGADGMEADNVARSLALPPTTKNLGVIEGAMQHNSTMSDSSDQLRIVILVNGVPIFNGLGLVKSTSRSSRERSNIRIQLNGDGFSVWSQLDGVNLRDLPLGAVNWNYDEIQDSWTEEFDWSADQRVIWAPVVYGKLNGPFLGVPYDPAFDIRAFGVSDMRPAVYIKAIVYSIFSELLGYSIESDFYNTDFFGDLVYLFGVGNDWENDADFEAQNVTVLRDTVQLLTPSGGFEFISFPTEVNDPQDNFAVDTFTAPFAGEYTITFEATTTNIFPEIGVQTFLNLTGNQYFGFQNWQDLGGVQEWTFTLTLTLAAGEQVLFMVLPGANTPSIDYAFATFTMLSTVVVGSDLTIATCLHKKSAKEFLRALTHSFCLAWFVDPIRKVVYFEPRFNAALSDQSSSVQLPGWYGRPHPTVENRLIEDLDVDASRSITKEIVSPFGDSVILKYAEDSNDPLVEYAATLVTETPGPYAVSRILQNRGKRGTESTNPMFTDLYLAKHDRVGGNCYLPTLLPSSFDFNESDENPIPEAEFTSDPKLAIISRGSAFIEWVDSGDADETDSTAQKAPLAIQKITLEQVHASGNIIKWKTSLAYASHEVYAVDTGDLVDTYPGLFETFHRQYFSIMSDGITLKAFIKRSFLAVITENFRRIKNLKIEKVNQLYILMEIAGFKPQNVETTQHNLVRYRSTTVDDVAQETMSDAQLGQLNIVYGNEPEEE